MILRKLLRILADDPLHPRVQLRCNILEIIISGLLSFFIVQIIVNSYFGIVHHGINRGRLTAEWLFRMSYCSVDFYIKLLFPIQTVDVIVYRVSAEKRRCRAVVCPFRHFVKIRVLRNENVLSFVFQIVFFRLKLFQTLLRLRKRAEA